MLRRVLIMLVALALAGTSAVAVAAPPVRDTLSGTVTHPDGSPAPATLQFSQWDPEGETWRFSGSAHADAHGYYSLDTAVGGRYAIYVYAAPAGIATGVWLVESGTDRYSHSRAEAALFASDAVVDLQLVNFERISGVIAGADGHPAGGTNIAAYWYDARNDALVSTSPSVASPEDLSGRPANAEGRYWVGNLLPGEEYVVSFGAFAPYAGGMHSTQTPSGFTRDWSKATPIQSASELDVTLPIEAIVSGTVRRSSGAPATDFPVFRVVDTHRGPNRAEVARTDNEGKFAIRGLLDHEDFALEVDLRPGVGLWNEPGYLRLTDDGAIFTSDFEEATQLRAPSTVDFTLVDTPSREGRLLAADGVPLSYLGLRTHELMDGKIQSVPWNGPTNSDGHFKIMNLGDRGGLALYVSDVSERIGPRAGYFRQCGSRFMLTQDATMATPITAGTSLGTLKATSDCDAPESTPGKPPTTPEPELPALISVSRPQLRSQPRVGQNLLVTLGTWRPVASEFRVQWLRDGKPIPGADLPLYVPTLSDVGHRLEARVEVSGKGLRSAAAVSAKSRKVPKSRAQITLKAPKKVRTGTRPTVTVRVSAPGASRLTGKVTLKYGTWVKKVKLTRARKGVLKVRLPKSAAGRKKLVANFSPDKSFSRTVTKDKSPKKTIQVIRR